MVDAETRKENFRTGLREVAADYGMDAKTAAFARALGLKSQQAAQKMLKSGSAGPDTVAKIVATTKVSLDWLYDRRGEKFPDGKAANFGQKSGAELEVDIDVLRDLVNVLLAAVTASKPDAASAILKAIEGFPYHDRGQYEIAKAVVRKAAARALEGSLSSALHAAHEH